MSCSDLEQQRALRKAFKTVSILKKSGIFEQDDQVPYVMKGQFVDQTQVFPMTLLTAIKFFTGI